MMVSLNHCANYSYYNTIDNAISKTVQPSHGSLLDLQSAFRLLTIHRADRHLPAMHWNNSLYIDTHLPFGLWLATKLFNILADLSFCIHYLDVFLTIGPPTTNTCKTNLDIIKATCEDLGDPLALEKVKGPASSLLSLGILLDSYKMEACLSSKNCNAQEKN